MAGNSMKTVWKVFCRNSTEPSAMAFPGFIVNYSWRKIFSAQWSNWKVAIVVLFSAGLVISWISNLIQIPLQLEQWWWRGMHTQSWHQPVPVVKWPIFCWSTGGLGGQTLQWQRMIARQTPGFHHAAVTFPRLHLLIKRVFTPPRPCMKVRICKLHGAEGGNWFWPNYTNTNTIQGNCSNAGSGCLWNHHFISTVSHATNTETAPTPFYSTSICFSCCCILSSLSSLLLGWILKPLLQESILRNNCQFLSYYTKLFSFYRYLLQSLLKVLPASRTINWQINSFWKAYLTIFRKRIKEAIQHHLYKLWFVIVSTMSVDALTEEWIQSLQLVNSQVVTFLNHQIKQFLMEWQKAKLRGLLE